MIQSKVFPSSRVFLQQTHQFNPVQHPRFPIETLQATQTSYHNLLLFSFLSKHEWRENLIFRLWVFTFSIKLSFDVYHFDFLFLWVTLKCHLPLDHSRNHRINLSQRLSIFTVFDDFELNWKIFSPRKFIHIFSHQRRERNWRAKQNWKSKRNTWKREEGNPESRARSKKSMETAYLSLASALKVSFYSNELQCKWDLSSGVMIFTEHLKTASYHRKIL